MTRPLAWTVVAVAAQHGMGVEPFERGEVEPRGDRGALLGIGDEVEPVAVADPVERQAVGKIAHASSPLSNASSDAPDSAFVEAAQRLAREGRGAFERRRAHRGRC